LPSSFCAPHQSGAHGMCHACHALDLDTPLRSTLPNLSLVVDFLENFFSNFIFEKLLSRETLVMGRVTATSNNQTQLFK